MKLILTFDKNFDSNKLLELLVLCQFILVNISPYVIYFSLPWAVDDTPQTQTRRPLSGQTLPRK